ncbi:MAG TPA: hypothetical protein VFX15_09715 [Actinomycetes bacterium]|nr:hypothetical protein [Actinomycetes bacterium]
MFDTKWIAMPVAVATSLLALPLAVIGTANAADASTTCELKPGKGIVSISVTGVEVGVDIKRGSDDKLLVDADLCTSTGGTPADMSNTKVIRVRGGVSDQSVRIDLSGGAFAPGRGDETGTSDEIEFKIALGEGLDDVHVVAGDDPAWVYAGSRKGVHRLNLNADEDSAVDADVNVRGAEFVHFEGGSSNDRFVGSGGMGTGKAFAVRLNLSDGVGGNDFLFGGRRADDIYDYASSADNDTLRGGAGADIISSYDLDTTGDLVDAGDGIDTCAYNEVDVVTNCELDAQN